MYLAAAQSSTAASPLVKSEGVQSPPEAALLSHRSSSTCLASLVAALSVLLTAMPARAAVDPTWVKPFPAFHIAGNLYYVGSEALASYLIVTPQGDILINSDLVESVPQISKSIESLGFHMSDVKILLISHGHYDHGAGSAAIKKLTGARYEVMDADVPVVQSGGRNDFQYASDKTMYFPPTHVDRVLHDGDQVTLGGAVLTAHKTAGHTRGNTTWTLDETEAGKTLHVVIVGSPNVNSGYRLVNNPTYPEIAKDYAHGFAVLKSLPCDIFLGAHGVYFDLDIKYAKFKSGDKSAFIDPAGYDAYVAERQQAFEAELKKQQAAH
jgi:metallo-beta-lactamase class B